MSDTNGVAAAPKSQADLARERIAAIEAKRAARRDAAADVRVLQEADDLEAFDSLEMQHGEGKVIKLPVPYFKQGLPTFVVVCAPAEQYMKRFRQMVRAQPKNTGPAVDMLGTSPGVVAYPKPETYELLKAEYGGFQDSVNDAVIKLSQALKADEGKDG